MTVGTLDLTRRDHALQVAARIPRVYVLDAHVDLAEQVCFYCHQLTAYCECHGLFESYRLAWSITDPTGVTVDRYVLMSDYGEWSVTVIGSLDGETHITGRDHTDLDAIIGGMQL